VSASKVSADRELPPTPEALTAHSHGYDGQKPIITVPRYGSGDRLSLAFGHHGGARRMGH
jgi:hypothetical protein